MFIPKKYGQSKVDICPFCENQAVTMNKQKIPTCSAHKDDLLDDLRCACGEAIDILHGKFGVFFKCIDCGNMNLKKVMEINTIKTKDKKENNVDEARQYKKARQYNDDNEASNKSRYDSSNKTRKEITVRSDDPRYFD